MIKANGRTRATYGGNTCFKHIQADRLTMFHRNPMESDRTHPYEVRLTKKCHLNFCHQSGDASTQALDRINSLGELDKL